MSDFLLQKSCKLLENKHNKRTKSEKQKLKKKKNLNLKLLREEELKNNILINLKKLEQFSQKSAIDVSEKVLAKCGNKIQEDSFLEAKKEATVFTEKDFEDFEKEYFDS